MKEEIKSLSPAEILLIINPTQPSLAEFLRVTIFDLASRGIIDVSDQGISQLKHEEKLLEHEQVLFDELGKEPTKLEEFSERLKKALKSGESFMMDYVYSKRISPYFDSTFLQRIIRTKTLNKRGVSLQNNLLKLIDGILSELRKRTRRDELKINEMMKVLDRNKIILDNIRSVKRILPKKERRHFYESYYFLTATGLNLEMSRPFNFVEQFETCDTESLFSTAMDSTFEAASGFDNGGDCGAD
jgi:hypothetical protein